MVTRLVRAVAPELAVTLPAAVVALALGQGGPLPKPPETLTPAARSELMVAYGCLDWKLKNHDRRVDDFNKKCGTVDPKTQPALLRSCTEEDAAIEAEEATLGAKVKAYIASFDTYARAGRGTTGSETIDLRVELVGADAIAQVGELACSPAENDIRHGWAEIVKHNWPMALVYFQQAAYKDPNNDAIKRSVDLSQWMVDYLKNGGAQKTTKGARVDPARNTNPARFQRLDTILANQMFAIAVQGAEEFLERQGRGGRR